MWPDNWTAVTQDGKLSAQFEHTLLVTDVGVDILTQRRANNGQPHFMDKMWSKEVQRWKKGRLSFQGHLSEDYVLNLPFPDREAGKPESCKCLKKSNLSDWRAFFYEKYITNIFLKTTH